MSTLRVNNITDTSGGSSSLSVPGAAKAWVNFNGTGVVAIRAQLNVSSITDNGVGDYTVNFTTAMSDANYAMSSSYQRTYNSSAFFDYFVAPLTFNAGSLRVKVGYASSTAEDQEYVAVSIFR